MKYKKSFGDRIFNLANTILMLAIFVGMVYPFLYVFNLSLSSPGMTNNSLLFLPKGFTLDSYKLAFSDPAIYRALFISISRSLLGPLLTLLISGMTAYALSQKDLIAGKFFRMFVFFTMYFSAGIIPTYLLYKDMNLTASYWVYIIPSLVAAFNIVLLKSYIESIPESLQEAVFIDGGNEFDAYWRVIFPVCLPVNAAVLLFSAITHWNSLMDTQLYNAMNPELHTIQYVLYNTIAAQTNQSLEAIKQSGNGVAPNVQSLKMACTVISVIPVMCVYPFLQKHFVSGIMVGSIKA